MSTDLVTTSKNMVAAVEARVNDMASKNELVLPADFAVNNALRSAFLTLQETTDAQKKPVLEVCTPGSISSALLNMCVQGLNPEKKQCYFIAYGDKLACQRSYFGSIALAKRVDQSIADVVATVIYEKDELDFMIEAGQRKIGYHRQSFASIGTQVVGAYAQVISKTGEVVKTEIMTMDQIKQSWKQSKMRPVQENGDIKKGSTHDKFAEEMCKKTVINKLCKPIINSSSDATLMNAVRSSADEFTDAQVQDEYEKNANVIDIESEAVVEDKEPDESKAPDLPTEPEPETEPEAQPQGLPWDEK